MLPFHGNLKCQEYITSLHPKLSRLLFKAKLGMFDAKYDFKNKYRNNLLCPICSVTDENLQHLTVCSSNPYIKVYKIKSSYDIYDNDLHKLKQWAKFLKKYEYLRNYMLEDKNKQEGFIEFREFLQSYSCFCVPLKHLAKGFPSCP